MLAGLAVGEKQPPLTLPRQMGLLRLCLGLHLRRILWKQEEKIPMANRRRYRSQSEFSAVYGRRPNGAGSPVHRPPLVPSASFSGFVPASLKMSGVSFRFGQNLLDDFVAQMG